MASVTVTLSKTAWTQVGGGLANGLVSNESKYTQIIQQAAVQPNAADVSGHVMKRGLFFNWAAITENMYARAMPNQSSPGTDCEVTAQA